jgi:hypothetical protein
MKKIIVSIALIALVSSVFVYFNTTTSDSNLPEPSYVPFEKQAVVGFYDWSLIGPSGDIKNLIADQGNVILIHLWQANDSSVEELETFQKLFDDYKTKIQFYFVTEDSQIEVRKFLEQHSFTFPVYFSMSPIPAPMQSASKPFTYLLNKKGRIIIAQHDQANWNSSLFRETIQKITK